MAFYILVALSYYAFHFAPGLFCFGFAGSAVLLSAAFIADGRFSHTAIAASLMYLLLSDSASMCYQSCGWDGEVCAVIAEPISEPSARKNRRIGYRARLLAVIDSEGSAFSAKGTVYAVSKYADVHYADRLFLKGSFRDGIFIASSTDICRRSMYGGLRAYVSNGLKHALRGNEGELSALLLLGSSDSRGEISVAAAEAGLSHVIALSGMHLSVICSLMSFMLFFLREGWLRRVLTYIPLIAFSYISGWRPSLLRALLFRIFLDEFSTDEAFMLSACSLLMLFPHAADDLGTLYSFLALSGIMITSVPLCSALGLIHIPEPVSSSLSASAGALLFTVPVTYSVSGCYQLSSLLTSLPSSLLIGLYMYASLAYLVFPCTGRILSFLYRMILGVFRFGAEFGKSYSIDDFLKLLFTVLFLCVINVLHCGCRRIIRRER